MKKHIKVGLILASILNINKFRDRIFAPKEIYENLIKELGLLNLKVYPYHLGNLEFQTKQLYSIKDTRSEGRAQRSATAIRNAHEYELELLSRAFKDAEKKSLDIIHVFLGTLAHYFAPFSKIPVVFTLHDPVFPKDTLEYYRLKLFSRHNYISISKSQAAQYKKMLNINSVGAVYNGINLSDFSFSKFSQGEYMAFLGRYIPEKGVDDAIRVAKRLKILLKLATSKNYEETWYYKNKIKPHLKSKYIREVDFLERAQRNRFLSNARVLIFPIKGDEPFGMAMVESMACGTPVVAFDRGSVSEIIKDGETGFIVNPSKGLSGFMRAVKKIYSMRDSEYKKMRLACRKRVEKYFTSSKMAEGYERIYRRLL